MTVEEPVLHKTARPVTRFDAHLGELLDDMKQTLTNAGGVGLAAPQIGILRRVVVVDDDGELIELVNPEILETSGEQDYVVALLLHKAAEAVFLVLHISTSEHEYRPAGLMDGSPRITEELPKEGE